MARDLRQIGFNKNNYPDLCYYYDSTAVNDNKLVKDSQPIGRFYKRDKVPFQWQRVTINGVVTSAIEYIGTIETADDVKALRPDMYVVDQTGALFLVVAPVISDDANKSKVVGTRPTIITTMTLRGVVQ